MQCSRPCKRRIVQKGTWTENVVLLLPSSKDELYSLLTSIYKDTYPGKNRFHTKLLSYPWKSIFTVNIDDLVENIYEQGNKKLFVQNENVLREEPEESTILYKMHGCVNNPSAGFIFSESEYTDLIAKRLDAKLNRFTDELQNRNIIFIGASMDEPDIKFYLNVYENAGCKYRTNKIIFIDPYPKRYLKGIVKNLGAELIEATTEEFLSYVESLKFNPDEFRKSLLTLNYNGVFRLSDIEATYVNPYESRLYLGDYCKWQDAADQWIIETDAYKNAICNLDNLIRMSNPVCCFSLYGPLFAGKSCLLISIGYYLYKIGYEILEYRGKRLNKKAIWNYIKRSSFKKTAIIIDTGSFYYKQIEKMLLDPIKDKEVLIITASREYYHKKKRYYLAGKSFDDFYVEPYFSKNDVYAVISKLDDKSHLSYLSSLSMDNRVSDVRKKQNFVNLIVGLTYGKTASRIEAEYRKLISGLTPPENSLLLELSIFDVMDIEVYPKELFAERYGRDIALDADVKINQMGVVDIARMNEKDVSLRNSMLSKLIISANKKTNVQKAIIALLMYISKNVEEKRNDIWYFIFQGLLKEEQLEKQLMLSIFEIKEIFLSVKEQYKSISYYWLQLGLLYQKERDYGLAFFYLQQSINIRPNSYKIQHALARNYLRYANDTSDSKKAKALFEEGERLMKNLIDSKDKYKEKAKPFSVTCYITEKIRFMKKYNMVPSNKELRYMINALESVSAKLDEYLEHTIEAFYRFMERIGKTELLRMDNNSPYLKYIGVSDTDEEFEMVDDPLN